MVHCWEVVEVIRFHFVILCIYIYNKTEATASICFMELLCTALIKHIFSKPYFITDYCIINFYERKTKTSRIVFSKVVKTIIMFSLL